MGHVFEPMSGEILNAAVEVHRALGPGFQEAVYESALCIELELRGVPFRRQQEILVHYKAREVGRHRLDLIVAGEIVVEIKAATELNDVHLAQALSYLKSSKIPVGLLLNFGKATLESRRVILG